MVAVAVEHSDAERAHHPVDFAYSHRLKRPGTRRPIAGAATRGDNYVWGDWLLPNTPGTFPLFVRLAGSNEPLHPTMTVALVGKSAGQPEGADGARP